MFSFGRVSSQLMLKRQNLIHSALKKGVSQGSLELIVRAEGMKKGRLAERLGRLGRVSHVYEFIPYISFECDRADAVGLVKNSMAYAEFTSLISSVEASARFSIPAPVKSSGLNRKGDLWNLINIGAYEARKYSVGEGVRIGIIDTGVEYGHPEVSSNFEDLKGYDFVGNNDNPLDRNGHGTHVAGISCGQNYGVAVGSTLYSIRVLDENGSGMESNVIAGVEWALKNGMDVVNMSLGSPVASSAFQDICDYSYNNGLVIVAAAGNDGGEYASYPAAFGEPVIAVAAVDRYNGHASFSNVFYTNDVSAPGVEIISSYIGGSYATLSGTSMAAPHVTGSIALALPFLRGGSISELIGQSAEALGDADTFGSGLVRADRMVMGLLSGKRGLVEIVKRIVW